MHTMRRLDRAYSRADVVTFNNSSRLIFFSDTHRGDGSVADEFAPNWQIFLAALRHYYAEDFTLFEVGDSDDLWEWPKYRHIVRGHTEIFDKLKKFHKEGRYYRIYGNHDMQLADPQYVADHLTVTKTITGDVMELFPGIKVHEGIRLQHEESDREFFVVHGHHGDFINDQGWRVSMIAHRVLWQRLHAVGIKSPTSPTRNSYQRHKVERNCVRWIRRNGVAMICGHTHRVRFPNEGDAAYFNSGSGIFNGYITGLEIVDGQIWLIRWQMEPDYDGVLSISRSVMDGPVDIATLPNTPSPNWRERPSKKLS